MDQYLEKNLLIDKIYEINSYLFIYEFSNNINMLNDYLIELRDNDSRNFLPVIHYIDVIMYEIKQYMRSLYETAYESWEKLDLMLYNLEMTKTKINQSVFTATDLSMIFKKLSVNTHFDRDIDKDIDMNVDNSNNYLDLDSDCMNVEYEADTEEDTSYNKFMNVVMI
jgi:hypothetical protein